MLQENFWFFVIFGADMANASSCIRGAFGCGRGGLVILIDFGWRLRWFFVVVFQFFQENWKFWDERLFRNLRPWKTLRFHTLNPKPKFDVLPSKRSSHQNYDVEIELSAKFWQKIDQTSTQKSSHSAPTQVKEGEFIARFGAETDLFSSQHLHRTTRWGAGIWIFRLHIEKKQKIKIYENCYVKTMKKRCKKMLKFEY